MNKWAMVLVMLIAASWLALGRIACASQPLSTILTDQSRDAAFKPFRADRVEMARAVKWGQSLGSTNKTLSDAQAPWRVTIDKDGEFAVVITPAERAAELGFVAGQQSLPEELVQERLDDLINQCSDSPLVMYVMLRSLPHASRGFGSAGRTRPGTPANVYEAQFLLDVGSRKFPALSADEDFGGQAGIRINPHGLRYRDENRPDLHTSYESPSFFENARFGGAWASYGATYFARWSFVDEKGNPAFGASPSSLRLTVLTPDRKREFTIDLAKLTVPRQETNSDR